MLTLTEVLANMIHLYGQPGQAERVSGAEVVLLLAKTDWFVKTSRGGKGFKIDKKVRLEECRFVARPAELRMAAQRFLDLADRVEGEFKELTSGGVKAAGDKPDRQTTFLDESSKGGE